MAETTGISWTDHTFNPHRGCTKVSAGCKNCYADTMSKRNPGTLGVWGSNGTRVVAAERYWREPLEWNRDAEAAGERRRVFCASLADVFEEWTGPMIGTHGKRLSKFPGPGYAPTDLNVGRDLVFMDDVRDRLFALIDATPNLDWLLLTKRPENVARMMPDYRDCDCLIPILEGAGNHLPSCSVFRTRPNVWLGTSVEDQAAADERIPHLLRVPAKVRFLSCEPMLGPVDLTRLGMKDRSGYWNALTGKLTCRVSLDAGGEAWAETEDAIVGRIDWVIAGGESGAGHRFMNHAWARSLRDQCRAAGVGFFFKQSSGPRPGMGVELDGEVIHELPTGRTPLPVV